MERVWNVLICDINNRRIETFNIFNHYSFCRGCNDAYEKCAGDKNIFAERIHDKLMYYFWSKFEWETTVKGLGEYDIQRQIDVYEQVMLNWDKFINFLWNWYEESKW